VVIVVRVGPRMSRSLHTYKSNVYAHKVKIHGDSEIVYSPDKPLSCGAHVWIQTDGIVEVLE